MSTRKAPASSRKSKKKAVLKEESPAGSQGSGATAPQESPDVVNAAPESSAPPAAAVEPGDSTTLTITVPRSQRDLLGWFHTGQAVIRDLKHHWMTDLPVLNPLGDVVITVTVVNK